MREFSVRANGVDFHALEWGSGPLVLCLHGFPDHARSFAGIAERIASTGRRVVAPNMRGFWPTSPAPDGCYLPIATGADAAALVSELGATRAVVVGHDWGAVAGYAAARLAPDRFSHLVAMSVPEGGRFGPALVTDPDQQRRSWYMYFFQLALADMALAHDDYALVDRLWAEWSPGYISPAAERAALKAMIRQPGTSARLLAYYRQALTPAAVEPAWRQAMAALTGPVAVPTLYLHGRDDGCIGVDLAGGMDAAFVQPPTIGIIEHAGHFLQLEQPDAVAASIMAFIADE